MRPGREFPSLASLQPLDKISLKTSAGTNLSRSWRIGDSRSGAAMANFEGASDILHWLRFEGTVRELFDGGFLPGVRAPMCVGLAAPEMRTLITLEGEGGSSAPTLSPARAGETIT